MNTSLLNPKEEGEEQWSFPTKRLICLDNARINPERIETANALCAVLSLRLLDSVETVKLSGSASSLGDGEFEGKVRFRYRSGGCESGNAFSFSLNSCKLVSSRPR